METRSCAEIAICLCLLLWAFTGCGTKTSPTPSLINHQAGGLSSIAPLDSARTASAQTGLQLEPALARFHLQVKVYGDTAQLSGTVDTDIQKQKAETVVMTVPGIKQVKDNIKVVPPSSP